MFIDVLKLYEAAVPETHYLAFERCPADFQSPCEVRKVRSDEQGGFVHPAFKIAQYLFGKVER